MDTNRGLKSFNSRIIDVNTAIEVEQLISRFERESKVSKTVIENDNDDFIFVLMLTVFTFVLMYALTVSTLVKICNFINL